MAAVIKNTGKEVSRKVRPLLSSDRAESKRRVLNLYRAWYRQIPVLDKMYEIPVTVPEMRKKLHNEFMKNRHIQDVRIIDMLVIKGAMELREVADNFQQGSHLLNNFKPSCPPKPDNFMSKFIDGRE